MRVKWYCTIAMMFIISPLCSHANPGTASTDSSENGDDLEIARSINQIDNSSDQDSNPSSGVTSNGSTYAKLLELEEKVRELNGKVQYSDYMNKKLIEKINSVSADVNYRLEQIEKNKHPVAATTTEQNANAASTNDDQQTPVVMRGGEVAKFSEMLKKKNYKEATQGLKKYIKVNADAADLDEAYFLLGKTYFAQNMHEEAGSYFLKYYKYYPTKPRASESLLNLAVSLVKLGRNDKACSILSRIDREYQNRSAAEQKLSSNLSKKIKCG